MPHITVQGAGFSGGAKRRRQTAPAGTRADFGELKKKLVAVPSTNRQVRIVREGEVVGYASIPKGYKIAGNRKPSEFNLKVKALMRDEGLSLGEASKKASGNPNITPASAGRKRRKRTKKSTAPPKTYAWDEVNPQFPIPGQGFPQFQVVEGSGGPSGGGRSRLSRLARLA